MADFQKMFICIIDICQFIGQVNVSCRSNSLCWREEVTHIYAKLKVVGLDDAEVLALEKNGKMMMAFVDCRGQMFGGVRSG